MHSSIVSQNLLIRVDILTKPGDGSKKVHKILEGIGCEKVLGKSDVKLRKSTDY